MTPQETRQGRAKARAIVRKTTSWSPCAPTPTIAPTAVIAPTASIARFSRPGHTSPRRTRLRLEEQEMKRLTQETTAHAAPSAPRPPPASPARTTGSVAKAHTSPHAAITQ